MGIYSSFIQYRMATRPVVSVYATADKTATVPGSAQMPAVFSAPIRDDIVSFCHSNMAKNRRQAHGVFHLQGHMHSAESWGTGRAVARIPRISGSGTSRADKLPSVTCAERVACSPLSEPGENGTERLTPTRRDTPSLLASPPPLALPSFSPEDTELTPSPNSPWLPTSTLLSPPVPSSRPSTPLDVVTISLESATPRR